MGVRVIAAALAASMSGTVVPGQGQASEAGNGNVPWAVWGLLIVLAGVFAYWGYCAVRLLWSGEEELTEAEIDSMRWDLRLLARLRVRTPR